MYILENAFHNVLRNRGRNILIGAIIFAVIITTVIALMINDTAGGIIDDYKNRFNSEVQITPNMERLREEAMSGSDGTGFIRMTMPSLTADDYINFGESEYLAGSVYTATAGATSPDITAVDAELGGGSAMARIGGMMMNGMGPDSDAQDSEETEDEDLEEELVLMEFYFNLQGNIFTDFENGTREISSGEMPDELNECIISADLADINGIQLGDIITFNGELRNYENSEIYTTEYTLTVVGIYDDLNEEYSFSMMQNAYLNRRNEILTTYETIAQAYMAEMTGITISARYFLSSPDNLADFEAELRAKGLPDSFDVSTDADSYDRVVSPVLGLKSIAITFMIVVLIFGGIIILLLSSIAIRERKYEIGVLRAMGMKKRSVAAGLWTEMLMVTAVCLCFGLLVGSFAAQPVTNILLEGQLEEDNNDVYGNGNTNFMGGTGAMGEQGGNRGNMRGAMVAGGGFTMFNGPQNSDVQPLSELDVSLSAVSVAQIIVIALLLASFAAFVSISRITKYEPIKILMERN